MQNFDSTLRQQIDAMGWLVKSQDYIPRMKIEEMLQEYKECVSTYEFKDLSQRYFMGGHGS